MQTFTYYKADSKGGFSHEVERSFNDHEIYQGLPPVYSGETLTPPPIAPSGMIAVLQSDGGVWALEADNTKVPYYMDSVDHALYLYQYNASYPQGALSEPPLAYYLRLLSEEKALKLDCVLTIDGVEYQYSQSEHTIKVLQSHTIKHNGVLEQSHTSPDGSRHLVSIADHSAITIEIGRYEAEVNNRDRELHDALVAASDMSTVDLTAGWPDTVRTTS